MLTPSRRARAGETPSSAPAGAFDPGLVEPPPARCSDEGLRKLPGQTGGGDRPKPVGRDRLADGQGPIDVVLVAEEPLHDDAGVRDDQARRSDRPAPPP